MKLIRRLVWIIVAVGAVALAAVGLVAWSLNSERATEWLIRAAESRSNGSLSVGAISGTLADRIVLNDLVLALGTARIDIDQLRIELDLSGILARALVIDDVAINRLSFLALADGEATSSGAGAELPVLVLVRALSIAEISIVSNERELMLGETRLAARYVGGDLEVTELWMSGMGFDVQGGLDYSAGGILDADICARGTFEGEAVDGCTNVTGSLRELEVDGTLEMPFESAFAGSIHLDDGVEVDLDLSWVDAELSAITGFSSPAARMSVEGTFDRLRVIADGDGVYNDLPFDFRINALLAGSEFGIEELALGSAGSELDVTGTVDIAGPSATLSVVGRDIDPGLLDNSWPGSLDLRTDVTVSSVEPLRVTFGGVTLGGEIRGYPIVADGSLAYGPAGWILEKIAISSRTDHIDVEGSIGETLDLSVDASVADLGLLWPELQGSLVATGTVAGRLAAPQIRGNVGIESIRYGEYSADRITFAGAGGLELDDMIAMSLTAEALSVRGVRADELDANLEGTLLEHRLRLSVASGEWALDAVTTGGIVESEWRGAIDELSITPDSYGSWTLDRSAGVVLGTDAISVSESCLRQAESTLCVEAALHGNADDRLSIQATQFDLGILTPLFPEDFAATGSYEIGLTLTEISTSPHGSLFLTSRDTSIAYALTPEDRVAIAPDLVMLNAELLDHGVTVTTEMNEASLGFVNARLAIDDYENPASPISGLLEFEWSDVSPVSLLSPEIGAVSGEVQGELSLGGNVSEPAVTGRAVYANGAVEVPIWGLNVEKIRAVLESSDDSSLAFTATGDVGDSTLELEGSVTLDPARNWPMELRLRGDTVQIVQLQDAEVIVSPDLTMTVALPRIDVMGSVQIPSARLAALGASEQAVEPSSDVVVHGREDIVEERPLEVNAELLFVFGDDVRYRDGNLDAKLTGDILVDYLSGRPTTASGTLNVGGQYAAYGNALALERGQLVFAGPWDNPSLDIRATRSIGEISVGVQLSGTLQSPITRLFSEPAMSEAEALSYLLLGQPLRSADGADTVTLESAALAMGLGQAVPVIERIGETLGLDEFTVQPTENDAGALMAGKYLSPKLYVRYTYGLFNRIGGLLLRYRITDRFSVETQSGDQKSMDFLYTVEKD